MFITTSITMMFKFGTHKFHFFFFFGGMGDEKKSNYVFQIMTELEILLKMLCSHERIESLQLNGLP